MAIHPEKPWLLFEDGGPTLRMVRPLGAGDRDLGDWERLLREYAILQRSLEGDRAVSEMLDAGTPDGRPLLLVDELARLLDDDDPWDRLAEEDRVQGAASRRDLADQMQRISELAAELANSGIGASVQHDDLHDGNVLVGSAGDLFFDWGDAVIAHPFATLTVTFNSIAHKTGLGQDEPELERLERVYLEAWTDVVSDATLRRAAVLARVFGCIGRSLAWERALAGLGPDETRDDADAVAGWLMEFADRLRATR